MVDPEDRVDLLARKHFRDRADAQSALFRYIDGWYNPRRIQAGLGGLSPDEYEAAWQAGSRNLTRLPSTPRAPKPDSEVSGNRGTPRVHQSRDLSS